MNAISLDQFASNIIVTKRLRFGDVRRLQRNVLPNGITSRSEAETLIALDRAMDRSDATWPGYLARVVKEFVLPAPGRCVEPDAAEWLVRLLSDARPKTAVAIAREVASGIDHVDDALLALAERPKRRAKPEPIPAPPLQPAAEGLGDGIEGWLFEPSDGLQDPG